jgi:hypothetical protein
MCDPSSLFRISSRSIHGNNDPFLSKPKQVSFRATQIIDDKVQMTQVLFNGIKITPRGPCFEATPHRGAGVIAIENRVTRIQ